MSKTKRIPKDMMHGSGSSACHTDFTCKSNKPENNEIESLAREHRRTKSRVDARRIVAVSLILSGKSYREVAEFMRVSINAVQNYLVTHYDKMALEPAYKKKFLTYYNAVKNLP